MVTAICSIMALAGHVVDPTMIPFLTSSITQIATALGAAVGGAIAIYGRFTAKKQIG